jgi:nucleolar complex protein 3
LCQTSDLCGDAIVHVFKNDLTGTPSLEAVQLLNRMIKERRYQVHPNALSCLLHLRLKTELGDVRASTSKAEKVGEGKKSKLSTRKAKEMRARGKGKKAEEQGQAHISKKVKKAKKELKEIQGEMEEAEAEVDREERAIQVCVKVLISFEPLPDTCFILSAHRNTEASLCTVLQHS